MQPTIDIQELAIFATVVQRMSFTAAAQHLDTDKGRISRAVARLERKLGVQLLNRTTRAIALTAAGQTFYQNAEVILADLAQAEAVARAFSDEPAGVFRVTIAPEFGRLRANLWLDELMRRHPKVNAEVHYTSRVVDLSSGGFDAAIRLGALADSPMICAKIGELEYALYASPDYLERSQELRHPKDLAKHQLVVHRPQGVRDSASNRDGRDASSVFRLHRDDEVAEVISKVRFRSNNVFATRQMCVAGMGIAKLPVEIAELVEPPANSRVNLTRLLPEWTFESSPIHILYAPSGKYDPKIKAFINIARNQAKRDHR